MSSVSWPTSVAVVSAGIPIYQNSAGFPAWAVTGSTAVAQDTGYIYEFNGSSWVLAAAPGATVTSVGAFGSSPNASGASISANVLTLQPADATRPGGVSIGSQTFAGDKTFSGALAASNLSGTNTGDISLAAVGSAPSANGASLSAQALTLQPADATHPGVVTALGQTFGGAKIFASTVGVGAAGASPPANVILYARATSAGVYTLANSYNTLVLESAGSTGLSIVSADANAGGIRWNSPASGQFGYAFITSGGYTAADLTLGTNQSGGFIQFNVGSSSQSLLLDANKNIVPGTAALATNATNGFLYLPTCAGTPTGVPTAYTGRVAHIYDTTNNKLYVYNGGWKGVTLS